MRWGSGVCSVLGGPESRAEGMLALTWLIARDPIAVIKHHGLKQLGGEGEGFNSSHSPWSIIQDNIDRHARQEPGERN